MWYGVTVYVARSSSSPLPWRELRGAALRPRLSLSSLLRCRGEVHVNQEVTNGGRRGPEGGVATMLSAYIRFVTATCIPCIHTVRIRRSMQHGRSLYYAHAGTYGLTFMYPCASHVCRVYPMRICISACTCTYVSGVSSRSGRPQFRPLSVRRQHLSVAAQPHRGGAGGCEVAPLGIEHRRESARQPHAITIGCGTVRGRL